ncbi:hypothetical protein [Amycolatopsis plumensis]|uniref:Uncharacterized protein n=1 Tax=Amycolatopsis plumensis TaxID=236508 RepID=A0ABV5UKW7_9PSEU
MTKHRSDHAVNALNWLRTSTERPAAPERRARRIRRAGRWRMNPLLPVVDWLMSAYDSTWHAFPAAQVGDPARTFYQALCDHSVPARHAERTAPRVFCPACLVLYGAHIPDEQRWQTDG